jgi:putative ABC transport system permease protein
LNSSRKQVRDSRRGAGVESLLRDVRYAARLLCRQPLGTAAVVLTLSIGIGTVAAVFTLLNGFVFRTPVSCGPGACFRVIRENGGGHGTASLREYLSWRNRATAARELAAWSTLQLRAPLGTSDPADVPRLLVTYNFFGMLGVDRPAAGRLFDEQDCGSQEREALQVRWRMGCAAVCAILRADLRQRGRSNRPWISK